jgi:hypothetical protein
MGHAPILGGCIRLVELLDHLIGVLELIAAMVRKELGGPRVLLHTAEEPPHIACSFPTSRSAPN